MRFGTNSVGSSGGCNLSIEYLIAISHALTAENTFSFPGSAIRRRTGLDSIFKRHANTIFDAARDMTL